MSIGKNIKHLRESRSLTQSELAEIVGVSNKAVSTWENDIKIPRMGAIQKMSDYFGVHKSRIIEDEHYPHYIHYQDLSPFDRELFNKFHAANDETKRIVCKILDVPISSHDGYASTEKIDSGLDNNWE